MPPTSACSLASAREPDAAGDSRRRSSPKQRVVAVLDDRLDDAVEQALSPALRDGQAPRLGRAEIGPQGDVEELGKHLLDLDPLPHRPRGARAGQAMPAATASSSVSGRPSASAAKRRPSRSFGTAPSSTAS
jgi:hypothetical protein